VKVVFIALIGTALVASAAEITVHTGSVIQSSFGGLGYRCDPFWWREANKSRGLTRQQIEGVLARRWLEQRPAFVRVSACVKWWQPEESRQTWESEAMSSLRKHLDLYKKSGSDVYLAVQWHTGNPAWLGGGAEITQPELQVKFARSVADALEHLIKQRGYSTIRYLCATSDLTIGGGAPGHPSLAAINRALASELEKDNLDDKVKLVGADEPANDDRAPNIEWAAENLDGILGAYGGQFFSDADYETLEGAYSKMADLADRRGKPFIIGGFGGRPARDDPHGNPDNGQTEYGLTLARHAIAALNGGVRAMALKDFCDLVCPDNGNSMAQWGVMGDVAANFQPRPEYSAWALMVRYFGKDLRVFETDSDDPQVHAVAARHGHEGAFSIALLNDGARDEEVKILFAGPEHPGEFLRSHVFPPPDDSAGATDELPPVAQAIEGSTSEISAQVPAHALAVITDELGEKLEDAVENFEVLRLGAVDWLDWARHHDRSVALYRLLVDGEVVAATTGTRWFREHGAGKDSYEIEAVPFSGVASDAVEAEESSAVWLPSTDPCDGFSKCTTHSDNITVDSTNADSRGGDGHAFSRTKSGAGRVVYECPDLRLARVVTYHQSADLARVSFFSSDEPEGPWEKIDPLITKSRATANGWREVVYALPDLPDSLNFLKIEFEDKSVPGNPQIGQVEWWVEP
jgi:hypothetical protein